MPQALGAQASFPGRQVISMSGDGGFSMLMGDFITLKQARLPVKVVIFDNCDLAFVDLEMRAAGLLQTGTELENPDFAKVAQAAGLFGVRVEEPEALEGALRSAFQHDGPAVVDVRVNREELILPPKITMEQLTRFGLWTAKAVLSGRGDEVLELARTNLRR
jgi:pyruvate dehydrogenase (quinone)